MHKRKNMYIVTSFTKDNNQQKILVQKGQETLTFRPLQKLMRQTYIRIVIRYQPTTLESISRKEMEGMSLTMRSGITKLLILKNMRRE